MKQAKKILTYSAGLAGVVLLAAACGGESAAVPEAVESAAVPEAVETERVPVDVVEETNTVETTVSEVETDTADGTRISTSESADEAHTHENTEEVVFTHQDAEVEDEVTKSNDTETSVEKYVPDVPRSEAIVGRTEDGELIIHLSWRGVAAYELFPEGQKKITYWFRTEEGNLIRETLNVKDATVAPCTLVFTDETTGDTVFIADTAEEARAFLLERGIDPALFNC